MLYLSNEKFIDVKIRFYRINTNIHLWDCKKYEVTFEVTYSQGCYKQVQLYLLSDFTTFPIIYK